MATQFEIDCALMAGRAYQTTRDPSGINWFPDPAGWTEFAHVPNSTYPTTSGFEAVAFQRGTEIVISFAGTNPNSLLDPDNDANIGLATGFGSEQLLQAAEYYLQVKAANPNATSITFTGHSLGGGLAALMGVFFGKNAVTFDQAPFANSAELNFFTPDVAANLKSNLLARGYSEADLSSLTNFLQLRETNGGIPNSNLITTLRVTGEFTSSTLPFRVYDAIGAETPLTHGPADWSGASFDLHSQSLLTTFVQNDQFRQVTFKLTDLLGMIFDDALFEHPTNDPNNENFLERLVRHQNGNAPGVATADAMLSRFTDDLWKLAQDGGLTMADDPASVTRFVSKTLTAFAMQMYYENTANATNANKELFTEVTGGVQFDRADVDATLAHAKGYNLYFQNYLNSTAFTDNERQLIQSLLPTLRDWYVQAGSDGMTVADAENRGAFMLGGNGADNLTGGTLADLLVGNAGADTLDGGAGIDTLLGGAGNDMLRGGLGQDSVAGGLGDDQITLQVTAGNVDTIDAGAGSDTLVLSGVVPGNHVVRVDLSSSTDQVVSIGGVADVLTQINFENLTASGLGSSVTVTGSAGANSIIGSNGNDSIDGGDGNDSITGGAGNDSMIGGLGNDSMIGGLGNDSYTIDSLGDVVSEFANQGNDTININRSVDLNPAPFTEIENVVLTGIAAINAIGDDGNNLLTGNSVANILSGGGGNDTLSGLAGNDTLFGLAGNDTLIGGDGNDQLNGGVGTDTLRGGLGNDSYTIDSLGDVVSEFANQGNDTININRSVDLNPAPFTEIENVVLTGIAAINAIGDAGNNLLTGNSAANILSGGGGNDTLSGLAGNDTLIGGDGNDQLNGGVGTDTLRGGLGNDSYTIDSLGDVVSEFANQGNDTININRSVDLNPAPFTEIENVVLTGIAAINAIGDAGNNLLTGNSAANILSGGGGNDTLFGLAGNDTLIGGDGNDQLNGGVGTDTLRGGLGNDSYTIDSLGDVVSEFANQGNDTININRSVDLNPAPFTEIENVVLTGIAAINAIGDAGNNLLTGNSAANILSGGGGNDTLFGLAGNDTLIGGDGNDQLNGGVGTDTLRGGLGNDSYTIDSLGDVVSEFANQGNDAININRSVDLNPAPFTEIENVVLTGIAAINAIGDAGNNLLTGNSAANILSGGGGNDTLSGLAGNDTLIGGDGNDQLNGGVGTDTLRGGLGNDSYTIDSLGDVVSEFANQGNDTININRSVDLNPAPFTEIENVVLTGIAAINAIGDAGNNLLTGNSAANILSGGGGNDTLSGLAGNDTLIGGDGNDQLNGGVGTDTLRGGLGNDSYTIDSLGDVVSEFANQGNDTININRSVDLNPAPFTEIENVVLTGIAAINAIGDAGNNLLTGNSAANILSGGGGNDTLSGLAGNDTLIGGDGNDQLNGGVGTDTLRGGLGNDSYTIDSLGDVVSEFANQGNDTININRSVDLNPAPFTEIENVVLTGIAAINAIGDAGNNLLTGNSAANILSGGGGNDMLSGLAGNDTLIGGDGNDQLNGGVGTDTLNGEAGDDSLTGGTGNDTFFFGSGDGQDLVQDNSGSADKIVFDSGINPLDLVISRQADNLRLVIHGSSDQITMQNWYANSTTAQVETIQAGNGQTLVSTQVDQLIAAMAQFTTDTGLSWDQGIVQQPQQVQAVLAANWQ